MKFQKKIESLQLCECLNELLTLELLRGNFISNFDNDAGWPHPNMHYTLLVNDLSTSLEQLNFSHQIFRDPHYGWHDECECNVHHDLLCAGDTQSF